MRTLVSIVTLSLSLAWVAPVGAQPAGSADPAAAPAPGSAAPAAPAAGSADPAAAPAAGSADPAAAPVAIRPEPPAQPPAPPPTGEAPMCRLAGPPPKPEPGKPAPPSQHSAMRQVCEDELIKDHDWWWNLVARLRTSEHNQTAREITTNNRHVVMAYAAIWLLAVGFLVIMWRRQQAMKLEIARLEEQLRRVEDEDAKRKAAKATAKAPKEPGDGGAA